MILCLYVFLELLNYLKIRLIFSNRFIYNLLCLNINWMKFYWISKKLLNKNGPSSLSLWISQAKTWKQNIVSLSFILVNLSIFIKVYSTGDNLTNANNSKVQILFNLKINFKELFMNIKLATEGKYPHTYRPKSSHKIKCK